MPADAVVVPYYTLISSGSTDNAGAGLGRGQPEVAVVATDDVVVAVSPRLKTKMTNTVVCRMLPDELLEHEGHIAVIVVYWMILLDDRMWLFTTVLQVFCVQSEEKQFLLRSVMFSCARKCRSRFSLFPLLSITQ